MAYPKRFRSVKKTTKTFPQFPKLPPEIRAEIWKFALAGNPTFLRVQRGVFRSRQRQMYLLTIPYGKATQGSISCVCHESHQVTLNYHLKIYTEATKTSLYRRRSREFRIPQAPGPFGFSYQHEIFYFSTIAYELLYTSHPGYIPLSNFEQNVTILALNFVEFRSPGSEQSLQKLLSPLKALKQLIFLYYGTGAKLPLRFDKGLRLDDNWICKVTAGPKSYYQRMLVLRYEVDCIFMLADLFKEPGHQVDVSFKRLVEIKPKPRYPS